MGWCVCTVGFEAIAAAAAADAAVDPDVRSGAGVRRGVVWLYMSLAASVASGEAMDGAYDDDAPYDWMLPLLIEGCLGPGLKVRSAMGWVFLLLRMPSRIWLATAMDMPQKSGTRCTHWACAVSEHSVHLREFFLEPIGSM